MTCASCSNRVERFLRKTDGVLEANVNLATEQARGALRSGRRRPRRARHAVEAAGYNVRAATAAPRTTARWTPPRQADADGAPARRGGWAGRRSWRSSPALAMMAATCG